MAFFVQGGDTCQVGDDFKGGDATPLGHYGKFSLDLARLFMGQVLLCERPRTLFFVMSNPDE